MYLHFDTTISCKKTKLNLRYEIPNANLQRMINDLDIAAGRVEYWSEMRNFIIHTVPTCILILYISYATFHN